ncbi:GIY-YIG nuclease family protein [Arthrobacter sp. lap29]|uniref:GIY-YIG nuclease family protein n=1 Tax=Arthrobacter sp. lap29 TaxID=3056122 RepID=UPI0028F6D230|nr:GIY-YIG nuclease family protein [Arthrobacter sp. lap29]
MENDNLVLDTLIFRNWPVMGVESLAFRFEPEDSRTGIYVLSFANGDRYVGKSLNVVNRFANHRRRWSDITYIAFRPFQAAELNARERQVLGAVERINYRVRNIDLAGRTGGGGLLDIVMEEEAQKEWLASAIPEPTDSSRYTVASRRAGGLPRFQHLLGRTDAQELIEVAARYIGSAIPWPSQTEGRFWVVSAMASTDRSSNWQRLVSISAQNVEVLVIGEATTVIGRGIEGFINVDNDAADIEHWIQNQGLDAYSEAGSYGPVGKVCTIHFTGIAALNRLLSDDSPVTRPAKALALNLMRKGPSMYTRFHNDHLADAIFSRIANQK